MKVFTQLQMVPFMTFMYILPTTLQTSIHLGDKETLVSPPSSYCHTKGLDNGCSQNIHTPSKRAEPQYLYDWQPHSW